MQIIRKKKFAIAALNLGKKAFIIKMAYLKAIILIYLAQKAQIALLIIKKINILVNYLAFANVILKKQAP